MLWKLGMERIRRNILSGEIPFHIAVTMDGNGRWAKRRGLPRTAGHYTGMLKLRELIRDCDDIGIGCLTVYAFSTENWVRPEDEVNYLMKLPELFFNDWIDELVSRGVRARFLGLIQRLPESTQYFIQRTLESTKDNDGMIVNFAFNYGGRAEIINAIKECARSLELGQLTWNELTEESIQSRLWTKEVADPDLLIRTSGEQRLSNFLTWQSAHTELWFTNTLWPDYNRRLLYAAISDFQVRRNRRTT